MEIIVEVHSASLRDGVRNQLKGMQLAIDLSLPDAPKDIEI